MVRRKSPSRIRLESALAEDDATVALSDGSLAKGYGLHHQTVRTVRRELEASGAIPRAALRHCVDGFERNVSRIGRRVVHGQQL